ncbi:DUF418 domain-containing protein [Psychroflexus gondwanensis]|jgi:uncharacterized protein|uniref:DUF418 domain-containing protein n=1 Tax=Psychroflexus gondwanensis TaxID=251 RepID=UPI0011BE4E18|nr:DUF418 domain-containing protein [Psychroflexus gondwanensis]TXE17226.1 DUF418 domain-containing protein [Psychroflexus gondwanensis]
MEPLTSNELKPTKHQARINALDVIRGIALFGILLMNINGMGLPFSYSDPSVLGHTEGLNFSVWFTNELFFEGTMRGLFTILFGAGVILLTSRLIEKGAGISTADVYYRRIVWLLLFGLVNSWLFLWDGDILYAYALFGFFLFPFRNLPVKNLLLIAAVLIAIGMTWDISDYHKNKDLKAEADKALALKESGATLDKKAEEAITQWEELTTKKTPEEIQEHINGMKGNYFQIMQHKAKEIQWMQTWFQYRYGAWDILSFMFLGMAFFKLKILHGERSIKFYMILAFIGYAIGLSVNYYETTLITKSNFDPLKIYEASQTYSIGRLFITLGHIGLFMLFIKSGILGFLQRGLAAVGRMALSNYLMHSIITSIVFLGFGLYGQLERYELYYVVFGIWIFQLITSPIWLKHFQFGPFEWLWRSLTYGKKQAFRISKS